MAPERGTDLKKQEEQVRKGPDLHSYNLRRGGGWRE